MGIYNFWPHFVPLILAGGKTHTARAERKYPDTPGATLHLHTGLRTKKAKLLMRVSRVKVESISIEMQLDEGENILCCRLFSQLIFVDNAIPSFGL
jgi:hypothetical protein